jgi:WD40 repeat protein
VFQNRLVQKLSVAGGAIVAILAAIFVVMQNTLPSRVPAQVCIPLYAADQVCYGRSQQLTSHKTTAIALNSTGTILADGYENEIELWDLKTQRSLPAFRGHTGRISAIAISKDEKILASSSLDGTIKLWDLPNHQLVSTIESGRVSNLVFSPDSALLISSSRAERWADGGLGAVGVQVWEIATRQRIYSLGNEPIRAIAVSPDGRLLATGDRTKTDLWQMKAGDHLETLDSGEVTGLLFYQDGQTLLTGSSRIKLWDLRNGGLLKTFDSGASDLALSPDGQVLATAAGGAVHLWQLLTEQSLGSLPASSFSSLFVQFALEGQMVVAAGTDGIRVWHTQT